MSKKTMIETSLAVTHPNVVVIEALADLHALLESYSVSLTVSRTGKDSVRARISECGELQAEGHGETWLDAVTQAIAKFLGKEHSNGQ